MEGLELRKLKNFLEISFFRFLSSKIRIVLFLV